MNIRDIKLPIKKSYNYKLHNVVYDVLIYCFINGNDHIWTSFYKNEIPKDMDISKYIGKIYIVPSKRHGIPKIGDYKFRSWKDGHYRSLNIYPPVIVKLKRYNFGNRGRYFLYHFYPGRKSKQRQKKSIFEIKCNNNIYFHHM